MNRIKLALAAALLPGMIGTALANEVIVSTQQGRGETLLSFDVAPTAKVAGFQFTIEDPRINEKSVDTSNCVSDLPKGVTGICKAADGKLGVIVFSPSLDALGEGSVLPVGTVRIKGAPGRGASRTDVNEVVFSDPKGKALQGTGRIEGAARSDARRSNAIK